MPLPDGRSAQEAKLLKALGDSEGVRAQAAAAAEGFVSAVPPAEMLAGIADDQEDEVLAEELIAFVQDTVGDAFIKSSRAHARALGQRPLSTDDLAGILDDAMLGAEVDIARAFRIQMDALRGRIAAVEEAGALDAIDAVLRGPAGQALSAPIVSAARREVLSAVARAYEVARMATREAREAAAGAEGRALLWTWLTVGDDRVCDTGELETSCEPRHGKVRTMDAWQRVGLPQAPNLLCSLHAPQGGSFCRCDLVEASRFDVPLKPVDASKVIADARRPFRKKKPAARQPEILQAIADVEQLLRLAAEELPRLEETLQGMNLDGVEYGGARVKKSGVGSRLIEKLEGKDPREISDYLGGRVFYDRPENVQQVMDRMLARGYRVQNYEDFTASGNQRFGYRAVHAQMIAPNGLSFELQIIPREISEVKDYLHEQVYSRWRGKTTLTAEEMALRDTDYESMRRVYEMQWQKFLARVAAEGD